MAQALSHEERPPREPIDDFLEKHEEIRRCYPRGKLTLEVFAVLKERSGKQRTASSLLNPVLKSFYELRTGRLDKSRIPFMKQQVGLMTTNNEALGKYNQMLRDILHRDEELLGAAGGVHVKEEYLEDVKRLLEYLEILLDGCELLKDWTDDRV